MLHLDIIKLATTVVNTIFCFVKILFCCVVGGEGWFAMLTKMSIVSKENHTVFNWSYMFRHFSMHNQLKLSKLPIMVMNGY
jgi:hypothetical protein